MVGVLVGFDKDGVDNITDVDREPRVGIGKYAVRDRSRDRDTPRRRGCAASREAHGHDRRDDDPKAVPSRDESRLDHWQPHYVAVRTPSRVCAGRTGVGEEADDRASGGAHAPEHQQLDPARSRTTAPLAVRAPRDSRLLFATTRIRSSGGRFLQGDDAGAGALVSVAAASRALRDDWCRDEDARVGSIAGPSRESDDRNPMLLPCLDGGRVDSTIKGGQGSA